MDREKLYDFLVSADRPMTIGEIHKQPQFCNIDRRELSAALCALGAENLAFRKLVNGKAYYSADPEDGVSRNPCQRFIADMSGNLNRALQNAQNPEAASLGDFLTSLRGLFEELVDTDEMEAEAPHVFTYHEGRVADCEHYTIGIPDGFVLEMDKDGRDFVAWLPDEDSTCQDDARITLFAGNMAGAAMEDLDPNVKSAEMAAALACSTQWRVRTQSERFLGHSEYGEIPIQGEVGGAYLYNSSNYQIMLGFAVGIKQMRVLVNDLVTDRESYHQAVVDWVGTLRLKQPFKAAAELNGDDYLPLTEESLDRWNSALEGRVERISALNNMRANICIGEYEYDAAYGTPSVTMLKRKLREGVKSVLPYSEEICESAAAFLERVCACEVENPLVQTLHEKVVGGLEALNVSVTLDGEELEEISPRKEDFRRRVDECFAAWNGERERLARVRRAQERAEAERRREEDARRREAIEWEIRGITDTYQMEEDVAEIYYRNEREPHECACERLRGEIQRMKGHLANFGSMDMGRKGALRAQIANTERELKSHEQSLAALDERYAKDRQARKAALDEEIKRIRSRS